MGQALAAVVGISPEGRPAALDELGVGLLEALGRGDRIVRMPGTAFLVADDVERGEDLGGEARGFLENLLDDIDLGVGEARQIGVLVDLQHVAQEEKVVFDRRLIRHGPS